MLSTAVYLKPQSHRACDHVTTYIRPQNKTNRRQIANKSYDWSQKSWVIVRANLVAARSMIMFKTLDLWWQIARGRKQVVQDRATSRAGSYHQSRMIVSWQVARLLWRLTRQPCDWWCHLCNKCVSRLVVRSITISDDWLHDFKIGRATSRHLLVVLY